MKYQNITKRLTSTVVTVPVELLRGLDDDRKPFCISFSCAIFSLIPVTLVIARAFATMGSIISTTVDGCVYPFAKQPWHIP